jgi:hypothetical protein
MASDEERRKTLVEAIREQIAQLRADGQHQLANSLQAQLDQVEAHQAHARTGRPAFDGQGL